MKFALFHNRCLRCAFVGFCALCWRFVFERCLFILFESNTVCRSCLFVRRGLVRCDATSGLNLVQKLGHVVEKGNVEMEIECSTDTVLYCLGKSEIN